MAQQSRDGTPLVNPMFYLYPSDSNTFSLDLQYFYGPGLLVAPVVDEGATAVDVYLPNDVFYDYYTHKRIQGRGRTFTVSNQNLTDIPLFIRGGVIIPVRAGAESAMTTTALRKRDFELLIPLGADETAAGDLYIDDGESIVSKGVTNIQFAYTRGVVKARGQFGFNTPVRIKKVTVLGAKGKNRDGKGEETVVEVDQPLNGEWELRVE